MTHKGPRPRWPTLQIDDAIAEGSPITHGVYKILEYIGYVQKKKPDGRTNGYHWYKVQCTVCERIHKRMQSTITTSARTKTEYCQACKFEDKPKLTGTERRNKDDVKEKEENLALLKLFQNWPIASNNKPFDSARG